MDLSELAGRQGFEPRYRGPEARLTILPCAVGMFCSTECSRIPTNCHTLICSSSRWVIQIAAIVSLVIGVLNLLVVRKLRGPGTPLRAIFAGISVELRPARHHD